MLWVSLSVNRVTLGTFLVTRRINLDPIRGFITEVTLLRDPESLSPLMACPLDISRWMSARMEITALERGWRNVAGSKPLLFPFDWKVVFI